MVREFGSEIDGARIFDLALSGEQSGNGGFPAFGDDRSPFVDRAEEFVLIEEPACLAAFVCEPNIGRGEIESGDSVEGDVLLLPCSFNIELGHAVNANFTFREQINFASILEGRAGE